MSSPDAEAATVGDFGCMRERGAGEGAGSLAGECTKWLRFLLRDVSECSSIELGEDTDGGAPALFGLAITLMNTEQGQVVESSSNAAQGINKVLSKYLAGTLA